MTNDNDELKARSVELAERAFRLRDRIGDNDSKEKLHTVGNELINIDNRHRFYDAQRVLETSGAWTEDQRALAHEISVADRNVHGFNNMDIQESIKLLGQWAQIALNDTVPDKPDGKLVLLGQNLQILVSSEDKRLRKDAVSYALSYVEEVLRFAHEDENQEDEMIDPLVMDLRNVRDSLLVHRELLYDEEDLLNRYKTEGETIERLGIVRHQLDELYREK